MNTNTIPTYVWICLRNSAGDAQYVRYQGEPKPCGDNRYIKPMLVKNNYCNVNGPVPASLRHLIVEAPE